MGTRQVLDSKEQRAELMHSLEVTTYVVWNYTDMFYMCVCVQASERVQEWR